MLRVADDGFRVRRFNDFAEIHHHHAMADVLDHREIVRDEEIRDTMLLLQIAEQIDDLRLNRNVQRAHRLVADDQFRLDRQRARDADALALPAGKFMRITLRINRVEADVLKQFKNPFLPRGLAVGQFVDVQRLADDLLDRHARIERAVRILKNHLELAPSRTQFRAAHFQDVLAVERDSPRRRLDKPDDGAAERRLAATALADEAERFARRDAEAHVVHRLHEFADAAEHPVLHGKMHLQVFDFEQRHAGRLKLFHEIFQS